MKKQDSYIQLRANKELIKVLDAIIIHLAKDLSGLNVTRSHAIRAAIMEYADKHGLLRGMKFQ